MEDVTKDNQPTPKYQPKFARVLIQREVKKKSAGGIIFSDAKRHAKCEGIIVGLGETAGWIEAYNDNHLTPVRTLDLGDKVIFGAYSGAWLDSTYTGDKENDDGTLFICQDADILAVIKE